MVEIDWRKDFKEGDLLCLHCGSQRLHYRAKVASGRIEFVCKDCRKNCSNSCDLSRQPAPILDGLVCPSCGLKQIMQNGERRGKKRFLCRECKKEVYESCQLSSRPKPSLEGFICPRCSSKHMNYHGEAYHQGVKKTLYRCSDCKGRVFAFFALDGGARVRAGKIAQFQPKPIKLFRFEDDIWDVRALLPSLDDMDIRRGTDLDFTDFSWMKLLVKQFVKYELNKGRKIATLKSRMTILRQFSQYLDEVVHVIPK